MGAKQTLKTLYKLLPFKQTVFSLLKKIWVPPFYHHLHFKGVIPVEISKKESFKIKHYGFELENNIFWKGITGWETESMTLWIELCRISNSIMDIGANTGVYSLVAKAVNPSAKIYAFEPVPRVFEKLAENNRLNNYDIVCSEYAASNFTGEATIYDTNEEHIYSVTVNAKRNLYDTPTVEKKIRTITLQDFIQQHGIAHIDLLKIDVETHEPEVLEGFGAYLQKFRPSILIEILTNEVGAKVEAIAKPAGYLFFSINEKTGIRKADSIRADDYNYLLCTEEVARQLKLT